MTARCGMALAVVGAALVLPASASAVTAAVQGGELVVTGGAGADSFALGHEATFDPNQRLYWVSSTGEDFGQKITAGSQCKNGPSGSGLEKNAYCPTSVSSIEVSVGSGDDDVGIWCAARYIVDPLRVVGGGGADVLAGASEGPAVTLLGGGAKDSLQGAPCGDIPHEYPVTAKGGVATDFLVGHCGPQDKLYGEDGNDFFFAKDGAKDLVSGGPGSDNSAVDRNKDVRRSIEKSNLTDPYCAA